MPAYRAGRERGSAEVKEHAAACLGVLVRHLELTAAAGVLAAPDPREAARQIWCALHGAVAPELKRPARAPDPAATYRGISDALLRGLASAAGLPDGQAQAAPDRAVSKVRDVPGGA